MVAELIDCIEQEPRFFIKEMMGTPHCSLLILLAVASAVASPGHFDDYDYDIDFEDFDAHEAAQAIVKVVIIVIGVVVFLAILALVCCCCLPCCFLAKRRTRNRGEVHQPAQPVQGGQGPVDWRTPPQQPGGYQMHQPGGYQPPPGGYQPPPGGYYPPPEQQQMVPPAYPVDNPPPYPGPPASYQDSFPNKQAAYNPNAV